VAITVGLIPEAEACAVSSRALWVRRFVMILFHAKMKPQTIETKRKDCDRGRTKPDSWAGFIWFGMEGSIAEVRMKLEQFGAVWITEQNKVSQKRREWGTVM